MVLIYIIIKIFYIKNAFACILVVPIIPLLSKEKSEKLLVLNVTNKMDRFFGFNKKIFCAFILPYIIVHIIYMIISTMKLLDFKSIFDVDEFVIVMFFILFILYIIAYIVISKISNNKKLDIFLSVFFCIVLISLLSLFGELNLIDYIFGEGVSSIKNVNDKHVVFYYFLQKSLVYINILVVLFSERNNIAKYLFDDAVN